jgi:omega-amidase
MTGRQYKLRGKTMELTISLGQMDVRLGEPAHNLATVKGLAAEAARRGSDILVLPELWSTGYDLENAATHATPIDQGIFSAVAELAQEHNLHILGSCLSLLGEEQYGNTAVLTEPDGRAGGDYSKIHLFRLMEEEQYLTAGDRLALLETAWGPSGLAICYDLRFPEMFRSYALAGARIVFLPSEWPHPRLAHWRTLLRARAIENQLYVVACNRVGTSKGTDFFGHSCIIDPWGQVVIEGGEGELLLTAAIDLDRVDAVRRTIPVFSDRRPDLYSETAF